MNIFRPLRRWIMATVPVLALTLSGSAAQEQVWVSDEPGLIVAAQQGWGELGLNAAAHQADKAGEQLRIGEASYPKGLGHHAPGALTILLGGEYARFEAEVGLQPCAGGSVSFLVIVDGETRFESPVLRSGDRALPVSVDLRDARELLLEARDGGDGMACDMANWANARLMTAPASAHAKKAVQRLDIASSARVASWDPQRTHGATASRIEEFRREDLFTETTLFPHGDGSYTIPLASGQGEPACIGLQWLGQRALKELRLTFPTLERLPQTNEVRLEAWLGESAWQGSWKPLTGTLQVEDRTLQFRPGTRTPGRTRKVRWVLPSELAGAQARLSAYTWSTWSTTNIHLELERSLRGPQAQVAISDGEFLSRQKGASEQLIKWDTTRPLSLPIRYSRPSAYNSDPTVLKLDLNGRRVAVAVADLLSHDCVYLPDLGLFVAREPLPVSLATYKQQIASRRSILEEVRSLPEQTLPQAMAKTHHAFQREGPVMLSLACDNQKFIVERDGLVRFHPEPFAWLGMHEQVLWHPWYETSCELRPAFGNGAAFESRCLEGGWLPVPTITFTNPAVHYVQTTFVAPLATGDSVPTNALCVVEFTATNRTASPSSASIELSFTDRSQPALKPELKRTTDGVVVSLRGRMVGFIRSAGPASKDFEVSGGTVRWTRELAPGATETFSVYLPAGLVQESTFSPPPTAASLLGATKDYWNKLLTEGLQVETPDAFLNDLVRSSLVRCFIAARSEDNGSRVGASIAAMSYGPLESEAHSIIRAMFHFGHHDFTRRSLDFFRHRYTTNGFLTTGYTTFGTAWHLWTVGEYYQLTQDKRWLQAAAPDLVRSCEWVLRELEKTRKFDLNGRPVPEFGLMPPGVLADWNSFAYHFAMNAYYAAGLREVGKALRDIGVKEAERFVAAGNDLQKQTLRAYAWTQEQSPALPLRDGTWIPHYPSQVHSPGKLAEFFPGQDAGRSWCYDVELGAHQMIPAGIISPDSAETTRLLNHMEDVQFLADGWFDYPAKSNAADWFNLGGFSKVQPFYTRNCEIYALRDDVKPFLRSYFNSLASLVNPEVLTFWEHFHHSGAWDKTHETGYFLHQTRTLLVQEREKDLWLLPFAPIEWLAEGRQVRVINAPTRFGPVSFTITSRAGEGVAELQADTSRLEVPGRVLVRLRGAEDFPFRTALVNGNKRAVKNGLVELAP